MHNYRFKVNGRISFVSSRRLVDKSQARISYEVNGSGGYIERIKATQATLYQTGIKTSTRLADRVMYRVQGDTNKQR